MCDHVKMCLYIYIYICMHVYIKYVCVCMRAHLHFTTYEVLFKFQEVFTWR